MNISSKEAIDKIKEIVKEKGSQAQAARYLDISAAYLGDIIKGNRPVSDAVAKKLGYKRVVAYEPIKQ